jgi:flavin-dependent amine oxidoreductase/putative NAD(P)-binding protein
MNFELDVAVVGGGVSGAYSAWRLQQAKGATDRIALFEYSNRIGGRMYTVTMPGLPNVKAEVGGMRFIRDQHRVFACLVDHLNLPVKDFPMGAEAPIGSKCNLFYLRGKHLRLHELADSDKVPYNLGYPERGLGPTNLQVQMMNSLYPNFGSLSLCDQMKIKVFGQPIWKYGFWNLAYRVLSNEGYQFMKDAGGYEANVANASAITQLPATEYSDSTKFVTLTDGFSALPLKLVEEFNAMPGIMEPGSRVLMNHRLAEIELGEGEYPYTLIFESTETKGKTTRVKADSEKIVVRAKRIILAMPRRSLELIKSSFFDHPWLQENLPSVLIQSAFKLFLAYERPWWRALGLVAGRSVTDLPVRQVYYFGTEAEQPGGKPFLNSLLMASYNDIGTVPFWKGLEEGEPYQGYKPSCHEESLQLLTDHPASDPMVRIAHKQVEEVHGLPGIPLPYAAAYHTWNEDPYGGGWHEWKAGHRLDQIMCRMRKPVAEHDIYIVGEAYSYGQGWVEGALDTAESTLQDFFGLPAPEWLSMLDQTLMPISCRTPDACGDLEGCVPFSPSGATDSLASVTPNCQNPPEIG